MAKSLVNGTVESSETYCPQDIDSFVAHARLQVSYGEDRLRARDVDFSHAYKTIARYPGSADAAYICHMNPCNNRPYKSRIFAHPFGSRRAPANMSRVVTFVQFLALKLLYIAVGAFVDDVYCAANITIAKSGLWAFKQLCLLIGFNTSGNKDQAPSSDLSLLGAEVSLLHDAIRAQAGRQRGVLKLRIHIAQALQLNCLTPAAASKMRDRLGSPTSLLMGKPGRGMMGPLVARQYHSRTTKLTRPLKRSPLWRHNDVGSLRPRATPFLLHPPFGAHSDAQGVGHIGCRVILDRVASPHTHLPVWCARMAQGAEGESSIYLFGICAAILTACVVSEASLNTTRPCVLCIDNQAALAALVQGSAASDLGTVLVGGLLGCGGEYPRSALAGIRARKIQRCGRTSPQLRSRSRR